jgi:hypothetical protein
MDLLFAQHIQRAINFSITNRSGVATDRCFTQVANFDIWKNLEESLKNNRVSANFTLGLKARLTC